MKLFLVQLGENIYFGLKKQNGTWLMQSFGVNEECVAERDLSQIYKFTQLEINRLQTPR